MQVGNPESVASPNLHESARRMFGPEAPASSIHELLTFLQQEDGQKFLYRGQVAHYAKILPSAFRWMLTGSMYSAPYLHGVDANQYRQKLTGHHALRFELRSYVIDSLGPGVGNLIAQQYGIGSEAIDVTADPQIAAFFATRTYPKYEHFSGSPDGKCGVIYRFPKNDVIQSLEGLEDALDRVGHLISVTGGWGWFDQVVMRQTDLPSKVDRVSALIKEHGQEEMILFTQPVMVEYSKLSSWLNESLSSRWGVVVQNLGSTRIARQHGGFIRPPIHWRCTVPAHRELDTAYLKRYRAYVPAFAIAEEPVAIEDTLAFPGLEIFYFQHSAEQVRGVTREMLWPSDADDDIYAILSDKCLSEPAIAEYLEEHDTWLEDPERGVIDRGYYTGAESTAWAVRLALRNGDLDEASKRLDQLASAEATADHLILAAHVALLDGDLSTALDAVENALKLDPDYWPALASRGAILVQEGEVELAVQELTTAIERHPGKLDLYFNRAQAYAQLSRPDLVVADCDTALQYTANRRDLFARQLEFLQLKALALTAWGRDRETDVILADLPATWVDVDALRAHIHSMRANRAANATKRSSGGGRYARPEISD